MSYRRPLYTRSRRLFFFTFFLASLPLVLYGAHRAIESNSNRVQDWLPDDFEETRQLRWFAERFGSGEILVLCWEGGTLDDPRIERVAEAVRRTESPRTGRRLFRTVWTPKEILDQLTQPPLELTPAAAKARLRGWLLGRDGMTACILALVSEEGSSDRHEAVRAVYRSAEDAGGIAPGALRVGGSTVDAVSIDEASQAYLVPLNVLAYGICVVLTYMCFRSLRIALVIVSLALFCELLSLANLYYTGTHMDSVSLLMASVVFVLSISASVHVVNYYREAVAAVGESGAVEKAVRDAFLPCFLAALTTAIGLGSLGISQIVPISKFGVYSAAAVLQAFAVIFLILPSALLQWPIRNDHFPRAQRKRIAKLHGWKTLIRLVFRFRVPVVATTFLLIGLAAAGLSRLETTVRLHDLFFPEAKILRDYAWIEEHLGPLVPVEVVIVMPKDKGRELPLLEQMILSEAVRTALEEVDGVGATLSASIFAPPVPRAVGFRAVTRQTVMRRRMERYRDDLLRSNYFRAEEDRNLWRISLRVPSGRNVDYGQFMEELKAAGDKVLASSAAEGFPKAEAVFCGGVPLVHLAREQLLRDLIESFMLAFALVGVTMVILLRSFPSGLLVMVPNIIPSLFVFGFMAWIGHRVEMGSMMTASVALGIAVDDTLHFITWFRRGLRQGNGRFRAVCFSYARCGRAMVQTSLICGLGLAVFALSPFVPISTFSWLMVVLLLAALLGDLVILPALLWSPMGWVFLAKGGGGRASSTRA